MRPRLCLLPGCLFPVLLGCFYRSMLSNIGESSIRSIHTLYSWIAGWPTNLRVWVDVILSLNLGLCPSELQPSYTEVRLRSLGHPDLDLQTFLWFNPSQSDSRLWLYRYTEIFPPPRSFGILTLGYVRSVTSARSVTILREGCQISLKIYSPFPKSTRSSTGVVRC